MRSSSFHRKGLRFRAEGSMAEGAESNVEKRHLWPSQMTLVDSGALVQREMTPDLQNDATAAK